MEPPKFDGLTGTTRNPKSLIGWLAPNGNPKVWLVGWRQMETPKFDWLAGAKSKPQSLIGWPAPNWNPNVWLVFWKPRHNFKIWFGSSQTQPNQSHTTHDSNSKKMMCYWENRSWFGGKRRVWSHHFFFHNVGDLIEPFHIAHIVIGILETPSQIALTAPSIWLDWFFEIGISELKFLKKIEKINV